MNKKGFTLIELLAVIIILGILMIIAIPSVTSYISNSRKSAYVDTAKEIVAGTRNVVNEGKLEMYSTDTTYYIPSSYIKTENASKSPYGEFVYAYTAIIYDGKGYKYYWISVDDTGQGVKGITPIDKLNEDDIESDIKPDDIKNTIQTTGIGNRKKIKILNKNGIWDDIVEDAKVNVTEDSGIVIKKGLALSSTSGSALCGRTIVIDDYTTDSDGKITCSSSNTNIATCYVYNKRISIRSIGVGTATITINQDASSDGMEATSLTYTFSTSGTCSWHFHYNYAYSGGSQICWMQCENYCKTNYNAYLSSCWTSSTSPPPSDDLMQMGNCWCKY